MEINYSNINNLSLQSIITSATYFFIREIFPKNKLHLAKCIKLTISRHQLTRLKTSNNTSLGLIYILDQGYKPKEFRISIRTNKVNLLWLLTTLAHEIIHIKQYRLGELVDTVHGSKWKGKFYAEVGSNKKVSKRVLYRRYHDLPWEREAWEKEDILFKKFINKHNIKLKDVKRCYFKTIQKQISGEI